MLKKLFILLVVFSPTLLFAQSNSELLKNWKSSEFPKKEELVPNTNFWRVYVEDNELKVTKDYKVLDIPKHIRLTDSETYKLSEKIVGHTAPSDIQAVDDGYLISVDRGEFGGELMWFSKTSKRTYELSSGGSYKQFITRANEILVSEGLAHLGTNVGYLMQIIKKDGVWKVEHYIKLPFAPKLVCLGKDGSILILTTYNIISVDKDKHIKTVVTLDNWDINSYTTSMVAHNNSIYIGMPFQVFKYSLDSGKSEWLTPNKITENNPLITTTQSDNPVLTDIES